MSAIAGFFGLLPGWLWAALVGASVLHGCWVGHQRDDVTNQLHDVQAAVAKQDAARAQAALTANSNFRKFEHQQAAQSAEIEDVAQSNLAAVRAADDRNRDRVDGLRLDVDRLNAAARSRAVSGSAACASESEASRREAENARALFLACAAEYRELGGAAAVDAVDLGTALKYSDLVQTPAPK